MRQKAKARLSFILRDPDEFAHNRSINTLTLGKSYKKDTDGDIIGCR